MPIFDPECLSEWSSGQWNSRPMANLNGFNIDSRKLKEGNIFVALKAGRDGHDFLSDAEENGAGAGIVEEVRAEIPLPQLLVDNSLTAFHDIAHHHRMRFAGSVFSITGSCGKTSTKDVLGLLLGFEETLCTEGNFNNHLGVPLTLLKIDDSLHKNCVIEAGINQIGEMSLLGKTISADVVIVTLIAPSHLEGLKNLETIASEKADLFLKSDQQTKVIFPEDCLVYKEFKKYYRESDNVLVLRNGEPSKEFSEKESFYSIWTETNEIGSPLSLRLWRHGLPSISFPLPELSSGMVRNVALAVLAACESGVSVHEISERLPQFRPSALRGRCFQGRGRSYVLDCYNANPASMLDSIDFFRLRFSSYAKLFVLAGMDELGHDEKQLHNDLGKDISSDGNEIFLLIGEKASWISAGLLDCGVLEKQIIVLPKLNDAVSIVEDFEGAVLFKGSRSYGLEELLPTWAVEECPDGGQIAC